MPKCGEMVFMSSVTTAIFSLPATLNSPLAPATGWVDIERMIIKSGLKDSAGVRRYGVEFVRSTSVPL